MNKIQPWNTRDIIIETMINVFRSHRILECRRKKIVAHSISAEVLWISWIWKQLSHNPSMVNRHYTIVSGTGTFNLDCKSVVYVKLSMPTSTFTYSPKTDHSSEVSEEWRQLWKLQWKNATNSHWLTHFIKSQIPFVSITHLKLHCGIEEIRTFRW